MAKCPICNSRKGKRKCQAVDGFVCTICCGETRNEKRCGDCSFMKKTVLVRNYTAVPHIPPQVMSDSMNLQDKANVIESAICQFDQIHQNQLTDAIVLKIVQLLMDKYFFGDSVLNFGDALEKEGFEIVDQAIQQDIKTLNNQDLSRIIGTIYRSVKRRMAGNRNYLEFIHQYVGKRVGSGVRVLRLP